ncbi:MAG TPA: hypothetical protein DE315_02365 [Candidatus Omnitrophica bacterium]|nr:MAG: hypothetical protein A2Y05_00885 [Omnitrophica WOR_2 bacterium GWA2_53_43]HBO96887.1 hypothetical protein [Candidatus Omnitrophota bacterium]HCI44364.1 hypothetical protein [Candidatus Omnitrophota bacterium]
MHSAIQEFRSNIERARALGGLYVALSGMTTPAVDATDILRAQMVSIVSALDQYVHELTRLGMLEVFNGLRPPTDAFLRFQVTIDAVMVGLKTGGSLWLEEEIREKHGYLAFQHPDKIADAIRHFSPCELWSAVAFGLGLSVNDVKTRLKLIIDRRNKIAHEADLDPSYPGVRWAISYQDIESATNFIENLCEQIHVVVV